MCKAYPKIYLRIIPQNIPRIIPPNHTPPATSLFGHRTKRQTHIDIRGFLSHEGSPVVTIGFNWKNSFQHMNQICGPRLDEMLSQHLGEEITGHVCSKSFTVVSMVVAPSLEANKMGIGQICNMEV